MLVADLLRARGVFALTTAEARNWGSSDPQQLEFAVDKRYCLLTHNRTDFEVLAKEYFAAEKFHFGIVIAHRRPPKEIVRRLMLILSCTPRAEIQNQLIYI